MNVSSGPESSQQEQERLVDVAPGIFVRVSDTTEMPKHFGETSMPDDEPSFIALGDAEERQLGFPF